MRGWSYCACDGPKCEADDWWPWTRQGPSSATGEALASHTDDSPDRPIAELDTAATLLRALADDSRPADRAGQVGAVSEAIGQARRTIEAQQYPLRELSASVANLGRLVLDSHARISE